MRWFIVLVAAGAVLGAVAGCGAAKPATGDSQHVAIQVTDKGFEPAVVTVRAGKPVTLDVTRLTDETCATELVMTEPPIKRELPLHQTVQITFTPDKPGDLKYACGMDMYHGTVHVE